METKFKDVANLYIGCDLMIKVKDDSQEPRIEKLIAVGYSDGKGFSKDLLTVSDGNTYDGVQFEQVKPILRPLNSITDEELLEVLKLWIYPHKEVEEKGLRVEFKDRHFENKPLRQQSVGYSIYSPDGTHKMTATLKLYEFVPVQFSYLLSKSFDLFGLLESGQALPLKFVNNK